MAWFSPPQEARGHVPPMAVVCNHGDGPLVIASQNSEHSNSTLRFEGNAIADAKLQHGFVGVHLTHESKALYDTVIQVYEFGFGQMIYVDAIHIRLPGGQHAVQLLPCPTGSNRVLNNPGWFF
jgi:hypothetical protein